MDDRRFNIRLFAFLLLFTVPIAELRAVEVLHYLPEDALAFAMVRNLGKTDARVQKLMRTFDVALPSPLVLAQATLGLGAGIDLNGDLLVAVLPSDQSTADPRPMVLLPIADYAKFAASVHADATGEICRVAIGGVDVLVAQDGDFAILMNVEHRETLEAVLSLEPEPVPDLQPIDDWLAGNNATIAIMPTGVQVLIARGRQAMDDQLEKLEAQFDGAPIPRVLEQLQQQFAMAKWLLDQIETEIASGALGIEIDDQTNLRFGSRLMATKNGLLATTERPSGDRRSPLAGFVDQRYVFAGGGAMPENWAAMFTDMSCNLMRQMPKSYGLEDLEEAQWDNLKESQRSLMADFQSSSMIMLPGAEGEPLFSNMFGIVQVPDSSDSLTRYQKAMTTWNEIMATSTSDIAMEYEINPITIAGAEACEIVVDVAAAARDPQVPQFNWMLEAMFGEDGKMRQYLVAADKSILVYGMADEQKIIPAINHAKSNEMGLSKSPNLQITDGMLSTDAFWKLYINPAGCVQLADRFVNEFVVHLTNRGATIPEFPDSPPLGISVDLAEGRLEVDFVCPTATLEAIASYIKTCQAL